MRKVGLGGVVVLVDEPAEAVASPQLVWECEHALAADRYRWREVERAGGLCALVVIDEDAEYVLKVATAHDQEPVEAFSANSADEALSNRVRLRRPHRGLDDLDTFAREDGIEAARELGVAVADQEAEPRRLLLERLSELTSLLGNPGASRIRRKTGEMDAAPPSRHRLRETSTPPSAKDPRTRLTSPLRSLHCPLQPSGMRTTATQDNLAAHAASEREADDTTIAWEFDVFALGEEAGERARCGCATVTDGRTSAPPLPCNRGETRLRHHLETDGAKEGPVRVLVVEDDRELAEAIATGLRRAQIAAADIATDGESGLVKSARDEPPAIARTVIE